MTFQTELDDGMPPRAHGPFPCVLNIQHGPRPLGLHPCFPYIGPIIKTFLKNYEYRYVFHLFCKVAVNE